MPARMLRIRFRRWLKKARWFVYHNVLHADDPPRKPAMRAANGMFITFTPTIGFQMLLVVFFAWLMRTNKLIGTVLVWISNPVTMVPIFYCNYFVGRMVLQQPGVHADYWRELAHPPHGWWPAVSFYWDKFTHIALPLWLGSVIVGLVLAYLTYYLVYYGVRWYRLKRWGSLVPPQPLPRRPHAPRPKAEAKSPVT